MMPMLQQRIGSRTGEGEVYDATCGVEGILHTSRHDSCVVERARSANAGPGEKLSPERGHRFGERVRLCRRGDLQDLP